MRDDSTTELLVNASVIGPDECWLKRTSTISTVSYILNKACTAISWARDWSETQEIDVNKKNFVPNGCCRTEDASNGIYSLLSDMGSVSEGCCRNKNLERWHTERMWVYASACLRGTEHLAARWSWLNGGVLKTREELPWRIVCGEGGDYCRQRREVHWMAEGKAGKGGRGRER